MRHVNLVLVMLLCFAMTGCANLSNQEGGTLTGAVVGGLLGSAVGSGPGRVAAIAGGAVIGGLIGGDIGRKMDRDDRLQVRYGLSKNRRHHWRRSCWPDGGRLSTPV